MKRFFGLSAVVLATAMQPAAVAQGQLVVEDTFVFTLSGQIPDGRLFTLAGDIFAQVGETAPLVGVRASEPFTPAVNDIFLSSNVTQLTENTGRFEFSVFTESSTTPFIERGATVEGAFLNTIQVDLGTAFTTSPGLNIPGIVAFTSSQITAINSVGASSRPFSFRQGTGDIFEDGGVFNTLFFRADANGAVDVTADISTFELARLDGTIEFEFDPALVPEPSSLALLSIGGLVLGRRRRRSVGGQ